MGQGQGIAPEAPNGRPQARRGICCTRHLVQLVDKCLARTSRSHYLLRLRGEGQHKPVPDGCSPAMSHKGRKCHVCCLLLPRPPGPSLDRGYIELRLGNSSEAGRRHIPGQVATHRVGRTARDARGNQCPSGHRRKHERLGNLGEQLVHPAPSALSIPSKLIDPSDNRCRLAKTSRAAISTWGSCWYLHATRPIPPQMRPSDGYAPG